MPIVVEPRQCAFGSTRNGDAPPSRVDDEKQATIERIRKILDRGLHPGTPVAEASRAMRLATEMMQRYELDRAAVYASTADQSTTNVAETGAAWTVMVRGTRRERWLVDLSVACQGFGVKAYSTTFGRERAVRFTFYGLSTSAEAAALAFELFVTQVPLMSAAYTPSDEMLATISAANARFNYRRGLCAGLHDAVREYAEAERNRFDQMSRRAIELRAAIEARRAEIDADERRYREATEEMIHDDEVDLPDDEYVSDDGGGGEDEVFAAEQREAIDRGKMMIAYLHKELAVIDSEIASSHALVVYRESTEKRVLNELKVTFVRMRPWSQSQRPRDRRAFDDGRRDAKRVRMQ